MWQTSKKIVDWRQDIEEIARGNKVEGMIRAKY